MAKRVLIVDDNKPLVRMMMSALETLPYKVRVSSAPSGEEALLAVMLEKPDLMVVDLNLPGMNGLDLIAMLRERYDELNIVMATGEHDPDVFHRAEELGVDYRFPKPFETVAFLDAVNRVLNGEKLTTGALNLPSEPPEHMNDSPELNFSDAVVELHEGLKAIVVAILGDNGHIIVQAGKDLNRVLTKDWEMPVMSAMRSTASLQRNIPGKCISQIQMLQTDEALVVLSPVGRHGLLVILPKDGNLDKSLSSILSVQQRISTFTPPFEVAQDNLEEPEAVQETEPTDGDEVEIQEIDITSLFSNASKQKEADSFWDYEETQQMTALDGSTGYLDFSQASQLGLTPDEE